jgi:hypothetical protein
VTARRPGEQGFSFVELLITLMFMTIALLAVTSQFPLGLRVSQTAEDLTVETNLAQELMEEIRGMLYWADPSRPPGTPLGPDGEADRWSFNDVDDFDGYSATPPYDVQGNAMDGTGGRPNLSRYSRSVSVTYADPVTYLSTIAITQYKRVTVTVVNTSNAHQVSLSMLIASTP